MALLITKGLGVGIVRIVGDIFCADLTPVDIITGYIDKDGKIVARKDVRLDMFIGDDRTLSLSLRYSDGSSVNLTDAKLIFTVKEKVTDSDADAVIQKKNAAAGGSDSQIKIIDPLGGSAEIYIVPSDTENVRSGIYLWDIQATLNNGKTYTVLRGRISLKDDITQTKL